MENKGVKFTAATLFTTALCNLNCSYCYICKDNSGCLKQIDDELAKDWEENKYLQAILEVDETTKESLDKITLWGGEPFIHMERFIKVIPEFLTTFKNVNTIDWSTNFTLPNQVNVISQLIEECSKYYQGKAPLILDCQISIDGYPEMNDFGRGQGVTEKFLQNFRDLCKISYNPQKIQLHVHTKPTLSRETFHFMDTPEKCYKWFDFFDKEMNKVHDQAQAQWMYTSSLWNCAQPTEWTEEDGKVYAHILQNILSVQDKVFQTCPSWKANYLTLIPEANIIASTDGKECNMSCKQCGGGCGVLSHSITPIPQDRYTACHRGIFDAYVDYSNTLQNLDNFHSLSNDFFKAKNTDDWIYTRDELLKAHNTMSQLYQSPHQIWFTDMLYMVREYAFAGIIDSKYTDINVIMPTLAYFMNLSSCIQDNVLQTGSLVFHCTYELPLFYNGAMDIIISEAQKVRDKKGREY